MTWAVWFTGLPGSGKSTIAKKVKQLYPGEVEILRMDAIRKQLTPNPKYTEVEREVAYKKFVEIAKEIYDQGKNVILDATGNRRKFRDYARSLIPNFKEVYIKCPLEVAMRRESERKGGIVIKNLYKKALAGDKGIGQLPGVNAPYEEPINPELIIESDKLSVEEAAQKIIKILG